MSNASATPKNKTITNYLSAEKITKAVASFFQEMGDATLSEFTLKTGRRVDLIALSRSQHLTIVEVKSSLTDFPLTRNGRIIWTGQTNFILLLQRIFRSSVWQMKCAAGFSSQIGLIRISYVRRHCVNCLHNVALILSGGLLLQR